MNNIVMILSMTNVVVDDDGDGDEYDDAVIDAYL